MASVVDCREKETEASETAQSQEVAEIPQKGWRDGEERHDKEVEGGYTAPDKQLLLPGPPLWEAEAAPNYSQTNLPCNF